MYFYPHSPCGERRIGPLCYVVVSQLISIHTLLAESDPTQYARHNAHMYFYPHSPCGERLRQNYECFKWIKFLSTLSLRRATTLSVLVCSAGLISIHTLLAESDNARPGTRRSYAISIHTLLAESDLTIMLFDTSSLIFLSTLSLRRATRLGLPGWLRVLISIHTLLAESDISVLWMALYHLLFLSTLSLRRATREPTALRTPHHKFLSTLSLRRATQVKQTCRAKVSISIHTLLAESD